MVICGQNQKKKIDWLKTVNSLQENSFFRKYDEKCGIFFTKNLKSWTVKPEIFHEDKTGQS